MPGNPHPFATPYADRDALALLGATKLHVRQVVANSAEVNNTDLSGQFAGLYIRSLSANFNLDTEDLQEDDGINVVHDAAGNHFVRVVDVNAPTSATYNDGDVSAGAIVISNDADYAVIDATSQVEVHLPAAADRVGRPLHIIDRGGFGFVPVTAGAETVNGGAGSVYTVSTPRGWLSVLPATGGYLVASAQL